MSVRLGSKADVIKTLRTLLRLNRTTTTNKKAWSDVILEKRLWNMDAGIEKRMKNADIVKKSARLVGLQVPDMYTDKEENKL
ncbi:hypothetical protein DYB37_005411 [Aphanomyces astaci]|uniref:Uncharacterized protein n=1 Tax=Aphanomyces astaci TaxID=112090 RepID=A0A3R7AQ22_APHAT|nr:hypothetical protein DYB35_007463 [Aphanomyces astaci]RHZ13352.1 hypothetical protein DYB37_005411 [Aphanomyces astaci]